MRPMASVPAAEVDTTCEDESMANLCGNCGTSVHRTRWSPSKEKFVGVDCGCLREQIVQSCATPFSDLTLDHIHNEAGQPIRVTSIHQLREAEKKYNFVHHVANHNEANFGVTKQQERYTVQGRMDRRFGGRG